MFEGLKIPRAHAPVAITGSSSGSDEGNLISDTLPSDYPSESHSEVEETRSLPVRSSNIFFSFNARYACEFKTWVPVKFINIIRS